MKTGRSGLQDSISIPVPLNSGLQLRVYINSIPPPLPSSHQNPGSVLFSSVFPRVGSAILCLVGIDLSIADVPTVTH